MHEPARATLWVRSFAPVDAAPEQQRQTLDRLRSLSREGVLESVTLRSWGKRVDRSSPAAYTESGRSVLEAVEEYRQWAAENGRSLEPFFRRERAGTMVDEPREVVRLPVTALAEYRDGDVVHVAPHADGEDTVGVGDRLAELEAEADVGRDDGVTVGAE